MKATGMPLNGEDGGVSGDAGGHRRRPSSDLSRQGRHIKAQRFNADHQTTCRRAAARVSRLFRINSLGGNCSHVIDKYISYTYTSLPVWLRSYGFRRMFAFRRNDAAHRRHTLRSQVLSAGSQVFNDPSTSAAWARRAKGHKSLPRYNLYWDRRGKRQRTLEGEKTKVTERSRNGKLAVGRESPALAKTGLERGTQISYLVVWATLYNRVALSRDT